MSLKIFSANDWENWIKSKLVSEDERLIPNKNSVVCKGCAPPKNTDGNCFPEIRKVYLKKRKEFHPDMLISKGLPEELIEKAKIKFIEIQEAYEELEKKHKK